MSKIVTSGLMLVAGASVASAATLAISVIDEFSIEVTGSGELIGPVTGSETGILFIDVDVRSDLYGAFDSIVGDLSVGSNLIDASYSGYNNGTYGGTLQLRSGLNGENAFSEGDVLSGTSVITFGVAHELTQSMFDESGALIWWDVNGSLNDVFQGYAVSPGEVNEVPLPASGFMVISALGGLVALRRRKKV